MREHRFVLTDRLWQPIAPLLPGKAADRGLPAPDNRLFLQALLWKAPTGDPWPDLPPCCGKWNSQLGRCRRWAASGVLHRLFTSLSGNPDLEYVPIDGAIVPVHQQAPGAKRGTQRQCMGRCRCGLTTKMVALVDALGHLVRSLLLPGQSHGSNGGSTPARKPPLWRPAG